MKQDKILGALVAAAAGDAMGAPVDTRPIDLIRKECGEWVKDYLAPLPGAPAPELTAGMVTDKFSLAFVSASVFAQDGAITTDGVKKALLEWKNGCYKKYYELCADPTTKFCIETMEGVASSTGAEKFTGFQKTINGTAAARAWVAGLFHPGDLDAAVGDAIRMGLPTHDNVIALSGAAAVAAATARAMVAGADTGSLVDAGLYGARTGYQRACEVAGEAPGASVEKRIELAVRLGLRHSGDAEACMRAMTDLVGTGRNANESIPAAFGLLVSAGGDVMETIYRAVNAGNACSMVATSAGAMAGALRGFSAMPGDHLDRLGQVNKMDFAALAQKIAGVV